ncbi:MAG: guanylate kinase [Armatimonadetes bacterium]|nr:guanylate kinase [Armatimonadota bacterium]
MRGASYDPTNWFRHKPRVFIVSGPSGVGKDTVLERLLGARNAISGLKRCVTATTRERKGQEVPDVDYHFLSVSQFEGMIAQDVLLEHAWFAGEWYGTPRAEVENILAGNQDALLKIEVKGALQVKQRIPEAVMIFIAPPSMEVLRRRIRKRHREKTEEISRRLQIAREEIKIASERYDYVVINDRLPAAARRLRSIIEAERSRIWHPEITVK